MSRLDLVIFGATGHTGKHAVLEMTQISKKYPGMTWGVAGRSKDKVEKILQEVSKKIDEDISSLKIIVADVGDDKSLKEMCSQARVLVNCCGPYRHYGEPVVKAAVENKTHYVDVSGETQFIETMQLKYNEAAREAGVYIINACGFDSIPVDLGVIFLQQNFGGTLNSVETYLSASFNVDIKSGSAINYGTWESLVYGLAYRNELLPLRKKLYPTSLPPFKPKLKPRSVVHRHNDSWCLPFPGADAAIVYRTQRYLCETEQKRPAQIKTYTKYPSFIAAMATLFSAVMLYIMTKTSFTRGLLLSYPGLFTFGFITKEDPSEEVTKNTTFMVDLFGEGWAAGEDVNAGPPTKKVAARVSGVNPGYGTTVIALLFSAITILKEQDKMPQSCGVLTPGAAFKDTTIVQRLNENNVKFEIVD